MISILISFEAFVVQANPNHNPELVKAIKSGNSQLVNQLITPESINTSIDENGRHSALGLSVQSDYPEITQLLINLGADINIGGCKTTYTPLQLSITNVNNPSHTQILLDNGADIYREGKNKLALHLAAEYGNLPLVRLLVELAPDTVDYISGHRSNPFYSAILGLNMSGFLNKELIDSYFEIVEFLLAHDVNINYACPGMYFESYPLHLVADLGFTLCLDNDYLRATAVKIFELIIQNPNFNVEILNARDFSLNTVLHLACRSGNLEIVRMILDHSLFDRALINSYNGSHETPLDLAKDHPEITALLILNGANQMAPFAHQENPGGNIISPFITGVKAMSLRDS